MTEITALYDSDEIQSLTRTVETLKLAQTLGLASGQETFTRAVARLRVAATVALADVIGAENIEAFLGRGAPQTDAALPAAKISRVFYNWQTYTQTLLDSGPPPSPDDLLLFAAAGFLADRQPEVRHFLRQPALRTVIDSEFQRAASLAWPDRVRSQISLAILSLIQQEYHADVAAAGRVIRALAAAQRDVEGDWLETAAAPRRDAFALLGLYHLAQAVERISEFLLAGSVEVEGTLDLDFGPRLRRLLERAEEYLLLSSSLETRLWLNAAAILLWRLRTDSIWVTGRGGAARIEALLAELARTGRPNPIFSLLPSQQDALRQNLLDRTRTAVVLQMPTSAGKTLLAEFSIVQTVEAYKQARVVYVAPTRALATQVRRTLTEDLQPLGLQISGAGSAFEEDPYELQLLQAADGVVVATPEKVDLLLRADPAWFDSLRLVIVDEAHLLKDSARGVRLELLLANLRREQPQARLLLLTPFVENAAELAAWLGNGSGLAISVAWRPSRLLVGLAEISGRASNRALRIDWLAPYAPDREPDRTEVPATVPARDVQTAQGKLIYLARQFMPRGTVLGMFSGSRSLPEKAAGALKTEADLLPPDRQPPALRLAVALARQEYGPQSQLAGCLERGVAFHHAALSPLLRYLIEDQVRQGAIRFIAATTTLAQGVNFPVATVLVHSIAKPYGRGPLTAGEFWNIAGRAGRVGLVDQGLVVFVNPDHRPAWRHYTQTLNEALQSALLPILTAIDPATPLEVLYRTLPEVRPFLQYLVHAAAAGTPAGALANVEDLLQATLAHSQLESAGQADLLRQLAATYLHEIAAEEPEYLKTVDTTGLGTFSFEALHTKIGQDELLRAGPGEIIKHKKEGLSRLLEALKRLPELELDKEFGAGAINVETAAGVAQGWMEGQAVHILAHLFPPAGDQVSRTRQAGAYIYDKISQTLSWGAHAYIKSWQMQRVDEGRPVEPAELMLPAYIQYGVETPEAAIASLLNIPRQLAEPFAAAYRRQYGPLAPQDAGRLKEFIETAGLDRWTDVVDDSPLAGSVDPADARIVWRRIYGLEAE